MAVQRPFEEILVEHGPAVMRVCRALLGPTDADDAWAETFLAALRAYPTLRPDSNVRAWLVTIAHRKSIDQIRTTARAPDPTDRLPEHAVAGANPADDLPDAELWAALAALPPKQRAAVVYHHIGEVPYAEIGALLETSEAAARRSAADGIANLRKRFRGGTTP